MRVAESQHSGGQHLSLPVSVPAMATSLKSFLPVLSRILGETPEAIYERQRALVRGGLLESVPGHGPGSGVRATPESVAMLLIGLLATVSLSESGPRARDIAKAVAGARCPLTGAKTFRDALARILSDEALAARVNDVTVQVNAGLAAIHYDGSSSQLSLRGLAKKAKVTRAPESSVFLGPRPETGGLQIGISVSADTVRELTKATIGLLSNEKPS